MVWLMRGSVPGLNAHCGGYSFTLDFLACQALS